MILQALVDYYEKLAEKGEIARPGWAKVKVAYALEIDENGRLLQVLPLKTEKQVGKKTVLADREMELPIQFKRSGVRAPSYFLCDNSQYCLGIEKGEITKKSLRCFDTFAEYHRLMLSDINDASARAMCLFVENWDPKVALQNQVILNSLDMIVSGGNFVFIYSPTGSFIQESKEIAVKWDSMKTVSSDEILGMCLVTGQQTEIARIHNSVKGIQTSALSPNGWTLVGFDKEAFESYGKTQSFNAPVGRYAAFAYTTALNQLLSDKKHVKRIGDTTVVYWAQDAEPCYQDAFSRFLDGGDDENTVTDEDLEDYMKAISQGSPVNWNGIPLNPDNRFCILGLAPNAARLSVRFFMCDGFGKFVTNLKEHYENIRIVSDGKSKWKNIPLWALLRETVNEKSNDKSPSPQMSGDTLRAILSGVRYPATLYQQTQLRIRAERKVTRGRAAIIKAYLLRNTTKEEYKEALKVELNESTTYQPYVLGRLFSVAEAIQERASGVTTIKDKYFTSACSTPSVVFPRIVDLAQKHLKKMDGGMHTYYAKQIGALMSMINESYPIHHNLYDQGIFQLGYYHQTQKRFEKKDKAENAEEIKEGK